MHEDEKYLYDKPLESNVLESGNEDIQNAPKRYDILQACENHDIATLVEQADSPGGLLSDELRRIAWPLLLGCSSQEPTGHDSPAEAWQNQPAHRDEEQVQRDVDRAFVYYPHNESTSDMEANRAKLFNLIVRVLRTHRMLCYFQGYHDIVQVLLLVLGESEAYPAVTRLSLCRIRDYMLPSLYPAIKHLRLIPAILELADAPLAQHLSRTEPFFALSATLTLYAHDIQEYSDIARLYDFILAHEPIIAIYLFACIILQRRSELMKISIEEPEMLHFTLSKLPQPLLLENLISSTLRLFKEYPPERLPRSIWKQISSSSVLKTARSLDVQQSTKEAKKSFAKQETQLYRQQLIKHCLVYLARNRRFITSVGVAIAVGGLAVWLRRSGHDRVFAVGLWQVYDQFWKPR